MATTQSRVATGSGASLTTPVPLQPRSARPVLWWAGLGALFLGLDLYVFVPFLLDLPDNVSAGPSKVPAYMAWNIHAQEVLLPLLALVVIYRWVVKPLAERQPVPWDGLAALSLFTMMWQNYLLNYAGWWSSYNSVVVNRGSWYDHVPGWLAPNAKGFAEAPVWNFGFYGSWILLAIWFCFIMRVIRRRWPHLGNVGLFLTIFAFTMAFDFATEDLLMRGGLYHYGGAPQGWWLMFSGHYYQFPLYEMPLFGGCLAVMAAVRFFKNDRGQTIAERGIDQVRISRKGKTLVRWLALCGIFNVIFLVYNISLLPFALNGGNWPQDVLKRSYFTQELCGAKTDRLCPGPAVPIPRRGSSYVNQDGGLSHPPNWDGPPPAPVPFSSK